MKNHDEKVSRLIDSIGKICSRNHPAVALDALTIVVDGVIATANAPHEARAWVLKRLKNGANEEPIAKFITTDSLQ